MTESERSKRVFGGIFRQGFYLAVLYCGLGLTLELLHGLLPAAVYERGAVAIYGLPSRLISELELQSQLISAVAQGRIPTWLAGALVPGLGVTVILALSLVTAAAIVFADRFLSLRQ